MEATETRSTHTHTITHTTGEGGKILRLLINREDLIAELERTNAALLAALEAIADMEQGRDTDHAQLAALCVGIARAAIAAARGEG